MKRHFWILLLVFSCSDSSDDRRLDIQGHRGARGLAPENSIPAFLLAADLGVTTLELDLAVSKDGQLVVSHEPYFSPEFCWNQHGDTIPNDSIINIYQLDYSEIALFDCGSKGNRRFPDQALIKTAKPLLSQVIDTVEWTTTSQGSTPLLYNIELKTTRATDTIFHPIPKDFSDLVYLLLSEKGILERVTIQSFDFRTLQYFHQAYPNVTLALLIENQLDWRENIDSLGFTPDIYSCYFQLLDESKVQEIQQAGMMVIPWTINELTDIEQMISIGVDGVITDYPDRALTLIK